ncbi:MAG: outer membrane protein transport protein [Burkholderiales bacterium]
MKTSNRIMRGCVAAALATFAGTAIGAGLAIGTQSGSGTGNAFAGGAASAEDASTVWFNPAGMTALPKGVQTAVAVHFIKPSFNFTNTGSTGAFAAPGSGEGGDGGDWAVVPQGFVTTSLGDNWRVGLAFNTPFGLQTEYDPGWRGRFTAQKSGLKTYNLNLGVAYKINDVVSIGGGASYQRLELDFNSASAAGTADIKASDHSTGFNAGALFQVTPATRIGLAYRSALNFQPTGRVNFSGAPGLNSNLTAGLTEPETASISAFSAVTPTWDVMADITWTRWSRVKSIAFIRTTLAPGAAVSVLTFNWRDTLRYSVGANYKMNDSWKFRGGLAYDQSPTNDIDRTSRIPDQNRTWLAFGAKYRISKASALDFGYAHEFIKTASVNNAVAPLPGRLIGEFSGSSADIISVQYTHSF